MSNKFKEAANKEKKQAGGVPEELSAGKEQPEVNPAATTQEAQPSAPAVKQPAPAALVAPVAPANEDADELSLVSTYEAQKRVQEPRSVRFQAVITQSVNAKLDELARSGMIKSRNDLVNFLLERYLDEIQYYRDEIK